ncbi:hypothetical protein PAAG_12599 [Paracoccidioides lutzii Pb01]|uniref:Uncharacterized protein n=1 Tax=Paracoccidioides lutzii (strain ATCC MYA-826 / Pb01) TaxID=502779 RepID=A0A0A2V3N1_PARBA|nr:hypothetical protein PAAG_12599 [Paracoccidioides lutzii Pb01]KGQ00735.1 hypothetical protein PAAG_12599 [Paracoccidioides lutzii Pb01]
MTEKALDESAKTVPDEIISRNAVDMYSSEGTVNDKALVWKQDLRIRWIALPTLSWGAVASGLGCANNYANATVLRLLPGMSEADLFAGDWLFTLSSGVKHQNAQGVLSGNSHVAVSDRKGICERKTKSRGLQRRKRIDYGRTLKRPSLTGVSIPTMPYALSTIYFTYHGSLKS